MGFTLDDLEMLWVKVTNGPVMDPTDITQSAHGLHVILRGYGDRHMPVWITGVLMLAYISENRQYMEEACALIYQQ